jgi:plasmid maintenance system antidote protein VapI
MAVPPPPIDPRAAALEEANRLSALLTGNPDDIDARVKFARVLAEALGKADAAIEQLELLARMPGATDAQRQEWLSLQADWHLKVSHDPEKGRLALERIAREFPQSHAAFEAQRRLYVLELEVAARQRRRSAQQANR